MVTDQIPDDVTESLREDAEQFGGACESTVVPTYHVRVTAADLNLFADTKDPLVIDDVALVWREDPPEDPPNSDFVVSVSRHTLERLADGKVVNYGIRHIGGENQMLHISKGGVSELFDDERTPTERIRQEQPHLRQYL